uniref:Uncharacterized protein n=1 Tax=Trichuris muris TaxID=70415 RepID=A0A5S6Q3X3_TRIMR
MASEIPVQSNNEVICNDVQITTGVEEVGVADHASNANISPNGFHLVAHLSVQLRVLNDSLDESILPQDEALLLAYVRSIREEK